MAGQYQLPSDGFDHHAYSGVIKSDGTWIPCEHDNEDWAKYEAWLAEDKQPPNVPDVYRSPADGGVTIKLKKDQVPVGVMLDSLSPEDYAKAVAAEHAPPPAVETPPSNQAADHGPTHPTAQRETHGHGKERS
jgi:hypothetical protein